MSLEGAADAVGLDVGAGDHRDPEQDRDRGQRRAQLALPEAAQGERDHAAALIRSRISSTVSPDWSSTTCPSARKTTRSATAAAAGVVGDHDDRLAEVVDRAAQQGEHVAPGARVEVAGRLVGEDDGRARDQRARHGDALLLAAGELRRAVPAAVREPDRVDQRLEPLRVGPVPGDADRQEDVLLGGEDRQQVVALEDEADLGAAQQREVVVSQRVEPGAGDLDRAARGLVEPGEDVHQRRLAGARGAHDRGEAAGREGDVDAAQGVDRDVALAVALRQRTTDDDLARRAGRGGGGDGGGSAHGSSLRPPGPGVIGSGPGSAFGELRDLGGPARMPGQRPRSTIGDA